MNRLWLVTIATALLCLTGCSEDSSGSAESESASEEQAQTEKTASTAESDTESASSKSASASEGSGSTELSDVCKDYKACCDDLLAWGEEHPDKKDVLKAFEKACQRVEKIAASPAGDKACQTGLTAIRKTGKHHDDWPETCK